MIYGVTPPGQQWGICWSQLLGLEYMDTVEGARRVMVKGVGEAVGENERIAYSAMWDGVQ